MVDHSRQAALDVPTEMLAFVRRNAELQAVVTAKYLDLLNGLVAATRAGIRRGETAGKFPARTWGIGPARALARRWLRCLSAIGHTDVC